jgi:uncharacterized protein YndB with AHSA1/START domain
VIAAERAISAPPERVYEFLADLRNHWRLEEGAFLELDDVDESGGSIRLRGPLGLSRTVQTQVLEAEPYTRVAGRADLRGGTVGLIAWEIRPDGSGSRVRLSAEVAEASVPDRLVLMLGGRRWFRSLFERALENLDAAL